MPQVYNDQRCAVMQVVDTRGYSWILVDTRGYSWILVFSELRVEKTGGVDFLT